MRKYLIAIVDDDPDDQEIFTAAFVENYDNIEIKSFSGGYEFLEFLSNTPKFPNVVVTDIRMPIMSGIEVMENMKANPKTKHIPVIILTGQRNETEHEKAMSLGAVYFFLKPVNIIDYSVLTDRIMERMSKDINT